MGTGEQMADGRHSAAPRSSARADRGCREDEGAGAVVTHPLFTDHDAWCGGYYELALELGPRSDVGLRTALKALWGHRDLDGCFLDRNREPGDQDRVSPED